jgi:hypothetical protein
MRGLTGGGLTMWRGFPITASTKQKLNTRSSTESELVGVVDIMAMAIIIWTCYFLLLQGYGIVENLLLQDNKSSILLEQNGNTSSSKRTRHINIRQFFITDWVNIKEISPHWCPTKQMVADFWTNPLQGSHFRKLRNYIMGRVRCVKPKADAGSMGKAAKKKVAKKSKVSRLRRLTVLKAAPGFWHNSFITIKPKECVGVYIVMGCTTDRPYLSCTDQLLRLKWIQIRS